MNVIQRAYSSNRFRKNSYTTSSSQQYMMTSRSNENYPRYAPIDMGPELPENFTLWPPTPQIGTNKVPLPVTEAFTYSLSEENSVTAPSWDASVLGLPNTQSMGSSTAGIVTSFDSPIGDEWPQLGYEMRDNKFDGMTTAESCNKSRGGYSGALNQTSGALREFNTDFTRLVSSYGSPDEHGLLDSSRYSSYSDQGAFDSDALGMIGHSRRLPDASTPPSSHEHLVPPPSDAGYDDYSNVYDIPPPLDYSQRTLSSTPLSPVTSPRESARPQARSGSRSRSSPSPRPSARSVPYVMESPRNKRWSTGSYYSSSSSNTAYLTAQLDNLHPRGRGVIHFPSHHTSPTCSPAYPHSHSQPHSHMQHTSHSLSASQLLALHSNSFPRGGGFLPNSSLVSHNGAAVMIGYPYIRRILGSNVESSHSHDADLANPPDLYASLQEEQIPPAPEDMNPDEPDMKPHEQELRFEGDLYTPRWVRGHGNKREGWCGICRPGRWLVLKNSAFWYDKSFTHGISAATGQQFVEPKEVRRMDGNPDVWEGLCHSCNDWVSLVSNKKKGITWFRHAYKCHTHPKIKDAPKRRRESSSNKAAAAAASAAKEKPDASSSEAVMAGIVNSI
ncbi:hypothetical protein BGX38DRAFT_1138813 [Terfezia claveryi]|nr:hypothetical protein BGX38DRAFT_1138813 [Terfezia claveryi]